MHTVSFVLLLVLLSANMAESMKTLKNRMKGHKAFIGTLVSKITPYCEASIEDVNVSKLKTELSYINTRLEGMDNLFIVAVEIMSKYVPLFGFWAFLNYKPKNRQ